MPVRARSAQLTNMEGTMQVGSIVKLKQPILGNAIGTLGVCYQEYEGEDLPRKSYGIIFANGNYDGFSPTEQNAMVEEIAVDIPLSEYKFTNVMRLHNDWVAGIFTQVLTAQTG